MTESTDVIASLKKAANYTKLAMRKEGPRSYKRGQGALLKVIFKFGQGKLDKDSAKKLLGWRGCDVRDVAKKAEKNGYISIDNPKDGFVMSITEMGTDVVTKRLQAEDKAADELLGSLTEAEKKNFIKLCDKISAQAKGMGVDYSTIEKKYGKRSGKKCCKRKQDGCKKEHGHGHCHAHHHGSPKYVFVFGNEEGHHHHHHGCHKH